jgi:hypothetical protein
LVWDYRRVTLADLMRRKVFLTRVPGTRLPASAYCSARLDLFSAALPHDVLGALTAAHTHDLEVDQRRAWVEELEILWTAGNCGNRP